jgi:hypothetical protein
LPASVTVSDVSRFSRPNSARRESGILPSARTALKGTRASAILLAMVVDENVDVFLTLGTTPPSGFCGGVML